MITIDQFVTYLDNVKKSGDGYRAACPAHGGKDPNLAIWTNSDGTIGTKCYSHGCDRKEIIDAVGFTLQEILPDRTPTEVQKHKKRTSDMKIKKALTIELVILSQWISAFYKDLYPEQKSDKARVKLAWKRIN